MAAGTAQDPTPAQLTYRRQWEQATRNRAAQIREARRQAEADRDTLIRAAEAVYQARLAAISEDFRRDNERPALTLVTSEVPS